MARRPGERRLDVFQLAIAAVWTATAILGVLAKRWQR